VIKSRFTVWVRVYCWYLLRDFLLLFQLYWNGLVP